jgi:L-lysine exporter family protein LysE/ArgO
VTAAPYFQGLVLCLSLIVAIGPQNAFLLQIGAGRRNAYFAAGVSAFFDLLLISLGAYGLGSVLSANRALLGAAKWAGAAYLCYLGFLTLHQAARAQGGETGPANSPAPCTRSETLRLCLGLAFLNPHVYIDTVGLMGAAGARYAGPLRLLFVAGAATGSLLWFHFLVTVGVLLGRWLTQPRTRRIFDAFVGLILFGSALWLAIS